MSSVNRNVPVFSPEHCAVMSGPVRNKGRWALPISSAILRRYDSSTRIGFNPNDRTAPIPDIPVAMRNGQVKEPVKSAR